MARSLGALAAGALVLVAGCTVRQPSEPVMPPSIEVPDAWVSQSEVKAQDLSAGWLTEFGDPMLEAIVAEALENNQDLPTEITEAVDFLVDEYTIFVPFSDLISGLIGAVAYMKKLDPDSQASYVGGVDESFSDFENDNSLPAAGVGVRFSISPENRLNVSLDWAVGKDNDHIYVYVGEAF